MATRGVNKAIIVGNLGADPETRYMPNGTAVANMNVATTETWRDKQSGEQRERTEWHRIVVFARLAEIASEYLKKGAKVYFEGALRTRKWQDRNGNDRYTTEIVANEMQMLDSKGSGGQQGSSWSSGNQQGSDQNQWAQSAASSSGSQESSAISPGNVNLDSDFDDDVPF